MRMPHMEIDSETAAFRIACMVESQLGKYVTTKEVEIFIQKNWKIIAPLAHIIAGKKAKGGEE